MRNSDKFFTREFGKLLRLSYFLFRQHAYIVTNRESVRDFFTELYLRFLTSNSRLDSIEIDRLIPAASEIEIKLYGPRPDSWRNSLSVALG